MKKMHISFFLFAFALSGCMVSLRPADPVAVPAAPVAPAEVVEQDAAPEIVFNEPVYYPPPLVAGFTYDHWMYVPNGPFIDIVFIDHYGVRHVEPWRHAVARMTLAHLPEWHRSYHVPRRDLQLHNERLREYAIKHPGSVKHPPGPAIKATNLPVNKLGEAPVPTRQTAPAVKETRINQPAELVESKPTTVQQKPPAASKQPTTVQQKPTTASKQSTKVQEKKTPPAKKSTTPGKKSDSDKK